MVAMMANSYGDSGVISKTTIATPKIAPNQVLIQVKAAGIDRGVVHLLNGLPLIIRVMGFGFRKPKRPVIGSEVAGVVVQVGSEVDRFKVGQRVFGVGSGTFAEFVAVKPDTLSLIPEGITFEQAAASAISGVTAMEAVLDIGKASREQKVLIIGASGGVGHFAAQLARSVGASVTAVASAKKLESVKALGVDAAIDYMTTDYLAGSPNFDLIIDVGGLNPIRRLARALSTRGTLVIVGGEGGSKLTAGIERNLRAAIMSKFSKRRLTSFLSTDHHRNSDRVAKLLENGSIKPMISHRLPLDQAAHGIDLLTQGKVTGKVVLVSE